MLLTPLVNSRPIDRKKRYDTNDTVEINVSSKADGMSDVTVIYDLYVVGQVVVLCEINW